MISDFNCKIFNTDRLNLLDPSVDVELAAERINSDLEILDSLGIHRLFCQVPYNEDLTLNKTFSKMTALEKFIRSSVNRSIRKKFTISVVPSIHLSENAPFITDIDSLTVVNTNYMFVDLPISVVYPDYLDGTINKILYNCKLLPIFNDFHNFSYIHQNTPELERIMKIKGAAFGFSLSSKCFTKSIETIKQIYGNGNFVLLSTSCEHDSFNISRISKNLAILRERLPSRIYLDIILKSHAFLR